MQELPHTYSASASGAMSGDVVVHGRGAFPELLSAPPPEFGGPGDRWSPETLLVAAIADCYVLTFRAIAHAARLEWHSLRCDVSGKLDRVNRVTQFTAFSVRAELEVPPGTDSAGAQTLLNKTERVCLVSNSLKGDVTFDAIVHYAGDAETIVAGDARSIP
jgi:organic hydroperoxide reductase OsmC/OhrA